MLAHDEFIFEGKANLYETSCEITQTKPLLASSSFRYKHSKIFKHTHTNTQTR